MTDKSPRSRPLFIVAAVAGVSLALLARPWMQRVAPAPQDEDEAVKAGFKSFAEEQEVGDLVKQSSISNLSDHQRGLLVQITQRDGSCKWFALGAISELKGSQLQMSMLGAVRPFLIQGDQSSMAKAVLQGWIKQGGKETVESLTHDSSPTVAKLASEVLSEGPR